MTRVVITGAGTVNALGHDVAQTFAALAAGQGAIGALDIAEKHRLSAPIGAQVKGWDAQRHFSPREMAMLDPFAQFALASARPVGRADEVDAALARTALQIRATGRADEVDVALARGSARPVGRADETDSALALFGGSAVGVASETDLALALAGRQIRAVGLSSEVDAALALTRRGNSLPASDEALLRRTASSRATSSSRTLAPCTTSAGSLMEASASTTSSCLPA